MLTTNRLHILPFTPAMAGDLHRLSVEADMRAFLPDEVYENEEAALRVIQLIMDEYEGDRGPFVYAVTLQDGTYIGHIEAAMTSDGDWEAGFHIGAQFGGHGYAAEALGVFLPYICEKLELEEILGICLEENIPSWKTLEKSGFVLEYEGQGRYQGFVRPIRRYVWTPAHAEDVDDFWARFIREQGFHPKTEYREALCLDEEEEGEPLLALVLSGKKTASVTSRRFWDWLECDLPEEGDFSILTDRSGRPRCVLETMEVHGMPMSKMPWELAMLEGEDADLEGWRARHTLRLAAESRKLRRDPEEDPELLLEVFEVLWQAE